MNKYTKEQLQGMDDFKINKALAKFVCKTHMTYSNDSLDIVCVDSVKRNYCNTPNDIMPLQEQHHICVVGDENDWCAFLFENEEMEYSDKKLCRAIACCLILVLQEKQK